jgi:hypothetical protein
MSSIILGDVLDELGLWGHVSRLIGASGHSTALTCGSSCGASYSVGCFCRTAAGRQKGGIGMAFNRIALVSCVINVQKPSTIYSAACLVGRSGPWSISLGDGGSLCCCLRLRSQIGGSRHVNGWSSGIGRLSTLVLVSRGIWLQRNNLSFQLSRGAADNPSP